MRGGSILRYALAGAVIAALIAAGYVSVGYAASAGVSAGAGPTDTEPPPDTTPAPDPAPPPPKPAPKPAPKSTASKPAPVYHAPVHQSVPSPTPRPTYTPTPVVHHATKKVVRHVRAHKPHKHVVTTPKVVHAQVKHASVVKINGVPTAAVTTNASDALRRSVVIAGIALAALLFLLVLAVPATAARFTAPGRVLMDHQTDLVLVGVAVLLLTALLFALTGNG